MKPLLTLIILISYIGLIFSAPIHFIHMAEGDMPMEHCPFAEGGHSVCTMTPFDHMKVWRMFTLVTIVFVLLSVVQHIVGLFGVPDLSAFVALYLARLRRETEKHISYFNVLFSRGILHPKIP